MFIKQLWNNGFLWKREPNLDWPIWPVISLNGLPSVEPSKQIMKRKNQICSFAKRICFDVMFNLVNVSLFWCVKLSVFDSNKWHWEKFKCSFSTLKVLVNQPFYLQFRLASNQHRPMDRFFFYQCVNAKHDNFFLFEHWIHHNGFFIRLHVIDKRNCHWTIVQRVLIDLFTIYI